MPVLQEQKPVLVALAAANVDLMECGIDIAHFKGQGLAQAQAHGIGGEDKDPVTQLASGGNEGADLVTSENVRQRLDLRGLDDLKPGPIKLEDVFPKEMQAIAVNLHGTPRMAIDQGGEVQFELLSAELIGNTIVIFSQAPHGPRIAINGCSTIAVQLQGSKVLNIKCVEAFLFIGIHW